MSKQLKLADDGNTTIYSTSRSDAVVPSPFMGVEYLGREDFPDIISKGDTLDSVIKNITQKGTITIPTSGWVEQGTKSEIWKHGNITVSDAIITRYSKIDIQPSPEVIKILMEAGIGSMQIVNDETSVSIYAIGDNPNEALIEAITEAGKTDWLAGITGVQVTVTKVFD